MNLIELYNKIGEALKHLEPTTPVVKAAGGDCSGYYDVAGEFEEIDLVLNHNSHKSYSGPHEDVDSAVHAQITHEEMAALDNMSGKEIDEWFKSIKAVRAPKSIKAFVFR